MKNLWIVSLSVTFGMATAGCGSSSSTPTAASPTPPSDSPQSLVAPDGPTPSGSPHTPLVLPVNASSSPNDVVAGFLNGMRDGNSAVTAALLSSKAQEETVKHNWPVQPPGAPSATYQLGNASFADPQQTFAQVPCIWSESDGAGGQVQFQVTWALRRQADGWRIAGFASEIVPGRPAYYFNFEDIAALKAAQAEAESALAEVAQSAERPPGVAENPNGNALR